MAYLLIHGPTSLSGIYERLYPTKTNEYKYLHMPWSEVISVGKKSPRDLIWNNGMWQRNRSSYIGVQSWEKQCTCIEINIYLLHPGLIEYKYSLMLNPVMAIFFITYFNVLHIPDTSYICNISYELWHFGN